MKSSQNVFNLTLNASQKKNGELVCKIFVVICNCNGSKCSSIDYNDIDWIWHYISFLLLYGGYRCLYQYYLFTIAIWICEFCLFKILLSNRCLLQKSGCIANERQSTRYCECK